MRSAPPGIGVAFAATLVMLVVMFVGRFTLGTLLLPELIAQQIFALVSPPLFTLGIRLFGAWAKWVVFILAILGYLAGGMGLGWLYARLTLHHRWAPSIWSGLAYGALVWMAVMTLGMPLLGAGLFGRAMRAGLLHGAFGLLTLHLLYGSLLGWLLSRDRAGLPLQRTAPSDPSSPARRALLWQMAAAPLIWTLVGAAGACIGLLGRRLAAAGEGVFEALKGLSPEVTPNEKFYTISKNLFNPTVNASSWTLKVHGLVENPLQLSLESLKAMPSHEEYVTFICISNEIGGNLMGNAKWRGVRVKDLLERARVKAAAHQVIFRADDGYSTGVPLERCLRPQTFLAYEMNGKELPEDHGFPVRAVIPGYYGMKQPKWVTEIEVVDHDYKGYWEQRGWADEAVVKTMSRIDVPLHRSDVSRTTVSVGGVAFSGERGIRNVEISADGGKTWQEAQVKEPLSPYSWVLWAGAWEVPKEGDYPLTVRATDGRGRAQEERVADPLPDGASGYHKIRVKVKRT